MCFVIDLLRITFVNSGHMLTVSGVQNAARDLILETLRKSVRNSTNNYFSPIRTKMSFRGNVFSLAIQRTFHTRMYIKYFDSCRNFPDFSSLVPSRD